MRFASHIMLAVCAGLPTAPAQGRIHLETYSQPPAKALSPNTSPPSHRVTPPSGGLVSIGAEEISECITPSQRQEIERQIALHAQVYGPVPTSTDGPALYPFWPQACNLHNDAGINNYVDLNAAGGVFQSYDCSVLSYDGTRGSTHPSAASRSSSSACRCSPRWMGPSSPAPMATST